LRKKAKLHLTELSENYDIQKKKKKKTATQFNEYFEICYIKKSQKWKKKAPRIFLYFNVLYRTRKQVSFAFKDC
jgi:hypothetical protein